MGNPQAPRGTHDIHGQQFDQFATILECFSQLAKSFGFRGIETPIFESLKVFDRSLGESSDIVSKEMYVFEDRGGDQLCLRPEGTAPIVRALISNSWTRDLPLKLFYSGPMFRYERPQKGRYRQFHQLGVEALGIDNPLIDAEIISLGYELLKALNLDSHCRLEINSLGSSAARAKYRDALIKYFESHKAGLSEDSQKRLGTNPMRILDSKVPEDIEINQGAPKLSEFLDGDSQEKLNRTKEILESSKVAFTENPHLVRGLDYYNDVVFEFRTSSLGAQDAVLSGGRYDSLVKLLGGPETPGVGFAAGIERLALLMGESKSTGVDLAVIPMSAQAEALASPVINDLRRAGLRCDYVYSGNMSKRLKKANKLGAKHLLILGEEELSSGKWTLKNYVSGEQQSLKPEEIAPNLNASKR